MLDELPNDSPLLIAALNAAVRIWEQSASFTGPRPTVADAAAQVAAALQILCNGVKSAS